MDKRVIIHCDDAGMTWGSNEAAKALLTRGIARSSSVMIPCPWAYAFVQWAKANPGYDVGIHLTLNAEWDNYRWGPVAGKDKVPTLCDPQGFFHSQHVDTADPGEVLTELRAQVETALLWGLKPTHLDIHMYMLYSKPEYYAAFLTLAEETGIPPIIMTRGPAEGLAFAHSHGIPVLSGVTGLGPARDLQGMIGQAKENLLGLPEGMNYLILHPNIETPEMPAVTGDYRNRHMNYEAFMDDGMERFLVGNGIKSTTWMEICG